MIIRLCRRRKEHRHILLRQIAKRLNGFERRRKQFCRQALRFIENDYRIRQPMQFPKIRGFCRKQPLEKSHGCGHNDWHIPALCKLSLLFCQLPLAMIFQQNVIPKDFPIFNCILFRQRNKRQHNDDSLLTVLAALAQRKMQQGQRFSCASRRCQGINSRRMIPRPAARFKQLIPLFCQYSQW